MRNMSVLQFSIAILLLLAVISSEPMIGCAMALAPSSSSSSSRPATSSSAALLSSTETTTCAVVGVGVLGTSLCRQLIDQGNVHVTGITKTRNRHADIRAALASPAFNLLCGDDLEDAKSSDSSSQKETKYDHVVFCAPPSGFDDYASAVKDAVGQLWNGKGVFVFTSSGAVYGSGGEDSRGTVVVTESTPIAESEDNPRMSRLIRAEQAVLSAGGCCLRLAGLYNLNRGAHNFWLTKGTVAASPLGMINLLHYDDAAAACAAALRAGLRSQVFLVSDGHPMTREEICKASLQAKLYAGYSMPEFAPPSASDPAAKTGKVYDATITNERLHWTPQYESFDLFMKSHS